MNKLEEFFEKIGQNGEPQWKKIFYLERANSGFRIYGWGSLTRDAFVKSDTNLLSLEIN